MICNQTSFKLKYRKTLDRNPRLLSVQITSTLDLYPGPCIYAGPCFYQIMSKLLIFVADALAYGSYCIRLMLLRITVSVLFFLQHFPTDFQKTFLKTAMYNWRHCLIHFQQSKTWFPLACIWGPASDQSFTVLQHSADKDTERSGTTITRDTQHDEVAEVYKATLQAAEMFRNDGWNVQRNAGDGRSAGTINKENTQSTLTTVTNGHAAFL